MPLELAEPQERPLREAARSGARASSEGSRTISGGSRQLYLKRIQRRH